MEVSADDEYEEFTVDAPSSASTSVPPAAESRPRDRASSSVSRPRPSRPPPQPPGRPACLSFANTKKLRQETVRALENPEPPQFDENELLPFPDEHDDGWADADDPAPTISTRYGEFADGTFDPLPSHDPADYEAEAPSDRFQWMKTPTPRRPAEPFYPEHGEVQSEWAQPQPEWAGPNGGEMPDKASLLARYYSLKADGAPVPEGMGPQSDSGKLLEAVTVGEAHMAEQNGLGMLQTGLIILFGLVEFANAKAGTPLAIQDITQKMMCRVHKFNVQLRRVWRLYFGGAPNHPLLDLMMAVSMEVMQEHLMNSLMNNVLASPALGAPNPLSFLFGGMQQPQQQPMPYAGSVSGAAAPMQPQPGGPLPYGGSVSGAAASMNAAPPQTGPAPMPNLMGMLQGMFSAMAAAKPPEPAGAPNPGTRVYDKNTQSWAVDTGDDLRPYVDTTEPVPKAPPPPDPHAK